MHEMRANMVSTLCHLREGALSQIEGNQCLPILQEDELYRNSQIMHMAFQLDNRPRIMNDASVQSMNEASNRF